MNDFLEIIRGRGFIHQCTDTSGLDALLVSSKPVAGYCGFDCTAPRLHVGSLVQIMLLRWFQKCGHRPIVLLGGATTKIGDPSGKDESRPSLSNNQIAENQYGIAQILDKFLDSPWMVNNIDWLNDLNLMDFIEEYGWDFKVNRMLSMDSVRTRLDRQQELTFLEFNYMILQAYDFVELSTRHGCRIQFGGSDQWGNIVSGVELNRRIEARNTHPLERLELFGLTTPLITTANGTKMGKTETGAIWLSDPTSAYDYWQFWRNTRDEDVSRFLRLFTELPISEIQKLEALKDAEINEAKKILATHATIICHGGTAALRASNKAKEIFG